MSEIMWYDCDDDFEEFTEYFEGDNVSLSDKNVEYWFKWIDWDEDSDERQLFLRHDFNYERGVTLQENSCSSKCNAEHADSNKTDLQEAVENVEILEKEQNSLDLEDLLNDLLQKQTSHLHVKNTEENTENLNNKQNIQKTEQILLENEEILSTLVEKEEADEANVTIDVPNNVEHQPSTKKQTSQLKDINEQSALLDDICGLSQIVELDDCTLISDPVENYLNNCEEHSEVIVIPMKKKFDLKIAAPSPTQHRKTINSTHVSPKSSISSEGNFVARSSAGKKTPTTFKSLMGKHSSDKKTLASIQRTSPVCTRSSGKKLAQAEHQVTETVERNVECNLCPKKCKSQRGLKLHLQAIHKINEK